MCTVVVTVVGFCDGSTVTNKIIYKKKIGKI
nr:MAG TPA: Protein of unknown function (DUF1161) [Caudoviricetes sp.]